MLSATRGLVIALALFSAVSAIGGGIELVVWRAGNGYFPLALLDHTPFASFLVPGLMLAIVVGGTSLASALTALRRSRAAVDITILAGAALTLWILAEVAMMRGVHWLHAVFGALGVTILVLGVHAALRSRSPRQRWMLFVTVGETTGFLVPTCAGILSTKAGFSELWQAALVVAAGFAEGALLGVGQAWAFPFPVRRLRYVLLSALGAGVVWASVMSMTLVLGRRTLPFPIITVAVAATALLGLAAIGSAQWLELRRHTSAARRWILLDGARVERRSPLELHSGPVRR